MTSGRVTAVGVAVPVAVAVPPVLPPLPVAPHALATTEAAINAANRARRRFMWDPPPAVALSLPATRFQYDPLRSDTNGERLADGDHSRRHRRSLECTK